MSVTHMAMVFAADGLSGSETLLLLGYTNYTDQHGYCWPSEKRLADDCGISVSTVARTKRALVTRSLVKSVRRVNPRTGEPISNLTRVNLPLLASMKRKTKHYDDDLIGEITFGGAPAPHPEDGEADDPERPDMDPDLLSCQSDSYPPSDCYVPPVNLRGTPRQSDSQSTTDPSVDPSVIPNATSPRSGGDVRRTETSGSTPARESGDAASGKTPPPRLTQAQRQAVQAVRALLPKDLNSALGEKTPPNISADILTALAAGLPRERTAQQLVQYRVMPRWEQYWASKFYAGELTPELPSGKKRQPFGPLSQMLADTAECGNLWCEDRRDFVTTAACEHCEMRKVDHSADRNKERQQEPHGRPEAPDVAVPTPRAALVIDLPAQDAPNRSKCSKCRSLIRLSANVTDSLCKTCRDEHSPKAESTVNESYIRQAVLVKGRIVKTGARNG